VIYSSLIHVIVELLQYLDILYVLSAVRMKIILRIPEKSKDHIDYMMKISMPTKYSGIRKRSNEQYLSNSPKSRQNEQAPIVLEERSNRHSDNLTGKIPRGSRGFESSKRRKVKEDYTIKSKPKGGEDVFSYNKRITDCLFSKELEPRKCLAALKKKRKFEDNILADQLGDYKDFVPSKTNFRSKARKIDNVKVNAFLTAYSFIEKVLYLNIFFSWSDLVFVLTGYRADF